MRFYCFYLTLILVINGSNNIIINESNVKENISRVPLLCNQQNFEARNSHNALEITFVEQSFVKFTPCDFCQHFICSSEAGLYQFNCRVGYVKKNKAYLNQCMVCYCCLNCLNSVQREKIASTNMIIDFMKLCFNEEQNINNINNNVLLSSVLIPLHTILELQNIKHKDKQKTYKGILDASQIYEFELICELISCRWCKELLTQKNRFNYCSWRHMKIDMVKKVKKILHTYGYQMLHHISRASLTMLLVETSGILSTKHYMDGEYYGELISTESRIPEHPSISTMFLVDLGIAEIVTFIFLVMTEKLTFVSHPMVSTIISALVFIASLLNTRQGVVAAMFVIFGLSFSLGIYCCRSCCCTELNHRAFQLLNIFVIYFLVLFIGLVTDQISLHVMYALHIICLYLLHLLFLFSPSDFWMKY